jgi:hypothetical protein
MDLWWLNSGIGRSRGAVEVQQRYCTVGSRPVKGTVIILAPGLSPPLRGRQRSGAREIIQLARLVRVTIESSPQSLDSKES